MRLGILAIGMLLAGGTAACGGSSGADQTPPMGRAALEQWLSDGAYKSWHCEAAPHDARSPSPHGTNRICSNDKASGAGAGEYPVGSAGVKELRDSGGIVGYAVYLHTRAGKGGDSWYWYERVPMTSAAPHDPITGVVADGMGDSGPAKDICVSCHGAAGSDAAHFGHDFVYVQVR